MATALDSAILLTGESVAGFIDRWRSRSILPVDPPISLTDAIPPHLTLLSPWHPDPGGDEAAGRLRAATRHLAPFRLEFRTVCTFSSGTVYLQPDPSLGLSALFVALTGSFPRVPALWRQLHRMAATPDRLPTRWGIHRS